MLAKVLECSHLFSTNLIEHGLKSISGAHHRANLQKDMGIIVAELMKLTSFPSMLAESIPHFNHLVTYYMSSVTVMYVIGWYLI